MVEFNRRHFIGGSMALMATSRPAFTQSYPSQDLTWLIYQAPGGSVDMSTRIIQPGIDKAGFKVHLEYAQGGGGRIARTKLFNAKPDGYTVMTDVAPGGVVDQHLYNVPYKVDNFEPIFGWILNGFHYCVKKDSPIRTFQDFVNETKKRRVTVGTIGRGGAQHLHVVAMRAKLGLNFGIVHFDGSSPMYTAILGGHIDVGGAGAGSGSRQSQSLHFLGMTGSKREQALADVPTIREQGFDVPVVEQLYFANTTPGVPADRLAVLTKAFESALKDRDIVAKMEASGDYLTLVKPDQIKQLHKDQEGLVVEYKEELKK
jgi:tripartite-type tricarboxylate transporter receptor subunit TctC